MRTSLWCCVVLVLSLACGEKKQAELCAGPAASKGPWSMRMAETEATVFWEARESGCAELELTLEDGSGKRLVAGATRAVEVKLGYGKDIGLKPADEPGTFHMNEVRVDGLSAGTCYRYRSSAAGNPEGRFCTARAPGEPIRFLAMGDTAARYGQFAKVIATGTAKPPDFVLHLGDIQYYAAIMESHASWFPVAAPLLQTAAFLPAVGNHENELKDGDLNEFDEYHSRFFDTPGLGGTKRWYRFASGGVHFLSVDTESSLKPGSPQRLWLEEALAQVEAEPGYRFTVVYFHKPIYSLGYHGPRLDLRAELEPLFKSRKVPLVLQAHVHGYERFEVGKIVYLTSGGGGATLYDMQAEVGSYPNEVPLRKAVAKAYNSVAITVDDAIRGEVIDEVGNVIDSFTIAVP